jgi:large subunit ribosomal protein L31
MKEGIHPQYLETVVTCGCGNTFTTRSTRKELKVDICNMCHPFYTGRLKYVDTAGRIEKFQKKFAAGSYSSLQHRRRRRASPLPKSSCVRPSRSTHVARPAGNVFSVRRPLDNGDHHVDHASC